MIDKHGYRHGVGTILINQHKQVLFAKRIGQDSWQFPQGGIHQNEQALDAVYRELHEEIGLSPQHVKLIAHTPHALTYKIPSYIMRKPTANIRRCIGQKQRWFLLDFIGNDHHIHLDSTDTPEFDGWRWTSYWYPLSQIIHFKQNVYRKALCHFAPLLFK